MGTVYRALDLRLDRPGAVKVLRDVGDADATRFGAEVQTLARFVHPKLVRLLDAGEFDEFPLPRDGSCRGTDRRRASR